MRASASKRREPRTALSQDVKPREVEAVIFFADIIGSFVISAEQSVREYDRIVTQFQECARQAQPAIEFFNRP